MLRPVAALASLLLALVLLPASAQAADGAQHLEIETCFTEPGLYTQCFNQDLLTNTTVNKSNTSIFVHQKVQSSFVADPDGPFAGCESEDSVVYRDHILITFDSAVQAYHYSYQSAGTIVNCFGESMACTSTNTFNYANGRVQYVRSEVVCQPL